MSSTIHAFDYLEQPSPPACVQVVFGDEPFLKRLVLRQMCRQACPDDDAPIATLDGTVAAWRDVHDELYTVSLFNPGGLRVAVVEDADSFVSNNRGRLEDYIEQPQQHGALILEVTKWAANTRLYKLVDKQAVQVECRLPQVARGRQKIVDQKRLTGWIVQWGKSRHQVQVANKAAILLLELIGPEFGLLDQELAKLALYADKSGKVSEKLVQEVGGGCARRRPGS